MAVPATAKDFMDVLRASRLLSEEAFAQVLARVQSANALASAPAVLARHLVKQGALTNFQARALLAGNPDSLWIGKCKILDVVGNGQISRVFRAEYTGTGRVVAVKTLPRREFDQSSAQERFLREARVIAQLKHPNIIQSYSAGKQDDLFYIIMEYVDGWNLEEYTRRSSRIQWQHAADYAWQASLGLQHAHSAGIIHRDIKPGNLLLDRGGRIKILDMGLALVYRGAGADAESVTRQHNETTLGTVDYLSPEQVIDSHDVDARADVYSLGCTFYFMLTGRPPFDIGAITQKLLWHQTKMPTSVRQLVPEVPEKLEAVLWRMLAKNRDERFPSQAQVCEAIKPFATPNRRPYDHIKSGAGDSGSFNPVGATVSGGGSGVFAQLPAAGGSGLFTPAPTPSSAVETAAAARVTRDSGVRPIAHAVGSRATPSGVSMPTIANEPSPHWQAVSAAAAGAPMVTSPQPRSPAAQAHRTMVIGLGIVAALLFATGIAAIVLR